MVLPLVSWCCCCFSIDDGEAVARRQQRRWRLTTAVAVEAPLSIPFSPCCHHSCCCDRQPPLPAHLLPAAILFPSPLLLPTADRCLAPASPPALFRPTMSSPPLRLLDCLATVFCHPPSDTTSAEIASPSSPPLRADCLFIFCQYMTYQPPLWAGHGRRSIAIVVFHHPSSRQQNGLSHHSLCKVVTLAPCTSRRSSSVRESCNFCYFLLCEGSR